MINNKFKLGQVVRTTKTGMQKPGVVYCINNPNTFYQTEEGMRCYAVWSELFGVEIAQYPIYTLMYPREVLIFSFVDFCRSQNLAPTDDNYKEYESCVSTTRAVNACEQDLKLVYESWSDWRNEFSTEDEFSEHLDEEYEIV